MIHAYPVGPSVRPLIADNPTVVLMAKMLEPLSDEVFAWEFGRHITFEARGFSDREIADFDMPAFALERQRRGQAQCK